MVGRVGVSDFLARHVVWPLWARRDDPRYPAYARVIAGRQFDPPEILAARQAAMLRRALRHAGDTVPYYRDLFRRLRFDPARSELAELPVLTKDLIRERGEDLQSEAYRDLPAVTKKTSGSTGVPLRVRLDTNGLAWKRACTLVADEWSGWRRGGRVAKAWGNPEYKQLGLKGWLRNRLYDRAIHLDTLKMSEGEIAAFANQLLKFRPSLIFGHAHSVYLLADRIRALGMPAHRPDAIITTAMVLHGFERRTIEQVFGCPVTNRYGCEEVSLIACECSAHRGLHVNSESLFVELVDGDGPARPGMPGKVVVTDLTNFAMPLIRYQVGDVATWADEPCPCGRPSPLLASVEGREADYVVTPSGHYVSGISLTENFATLVPGIAQLQIVQEAVDRLRFRIVRGREFDDSSEAKIAGLVRERFGAATRFTCEYLAQIPQEPSGKYRFCISHVATGGQAA